MVKEVKDRVSETATRRKKRVSKKNKVAWRKHCSSKDVDAFLDGLRLEERVGGLLSTREDNKLFYVDTSLSAPQAKKEKTREERKREASKKLRGIPKCYESLVNQSAVPDPVIKRNKIRTSEERKHPVVKKIEADRKARGILKAKEKMVIKNRMIHKERKSNSYKVGDFKTDLWNEENEPLDVEWLSPITLQHNLQNSQKLKKKVPATITKKPSVLPAIEIPHPGTSYNPSYKDHRSLLQEIVNREKEVIKESEHLQRVTTSMFSKVTQEEKDDTWVKEMLQGLSEPDERNERDNAEISVYKAINPPAQDKKKTRKTRRNIRLAKDEEYQRKLKAIEKKKVADIYKLKKIVHSVDANEVKLLTKQEKRSQKRKMKELGAKRLARLKYEEPELDFSMPYDLKGNLRGMQAEGNILRDRLKSMQRRNILQPTMIRSHKKAKKKVYVKKSHKDE